MEQHEQQHRGQEQLVVGNAKLLRIHCYFWSFIVALSTESNPKPQKADREGILGNAWGGSPFPGACKITLSR